MKINDLFEQTKLNQKEKQKKELPANFFEVAKKHMEDHKELYDRLSK